MPKGQGKGRGNEVELLHRNWVLHGSCLQVEVMEQRVQQESVIFANEECGSTKVGSLRLQGWRWLRQCQNYLEMNIGVLYAMRSEA